MFAFPLISRTLLACAAITSMLRAADGPTTPPREERGVIIGDRSSPPTPPPINEIDLRRAFSEITRDTNRAVVAIIVGGEQVALGTIVAPDGYIVTCSSEVVEPATVRLPGGRSVPARVAGRALEYDLALLKVDSDGLHTARLKEGTDVAVGKWIASIGMSEVPLAVGVVSVGRRVIPADAIMGVFLEDSDAEGGEIPGALVVRLDPQGGAARAGVRVGDIIIKIDEQSVVERQDVLTGLSRMQPGQKVSVLVARGEDRLTLTVALSKRPAASTRSLRQNTMGGKLSNRRTGFAAVLQHDGVTLQPRDCGSPVVTLDGEVVGINVSRAGRTETYAVPSGVAAKVVEELRRADGEARDTIVSSDERPDPDSVATRPRTDSPATQPHR